jgi:alpha-amylase
MTDTVGADAPNVGEFWADIYMHDMDNSPGGRQALARYMDKAGQSLSMFDFPSKIALKWAFEQGRFDLLRDRAGKPSGLIGWWPEAAVTFVDNHDTGTAPFF